MKNLPRLSKLYNACLESLNQSVNRFDEDEDMVAMECPLMYQDDEVGTLKYTLHQRVLWGAQKESYEYPPMSADVESIALYPYVDSLYSNDGNRLLNVEKRLNAMLQAKYKF